MKRISGSIIALSIFMVACSLTYYFAYFRPHLEDEQRRETAQLKAISTKGLRDCLIDVDTRLSHMSSVSGYEWEKIVLPYTKEQKDNCFKMFPQDSIYK